MDHPTSPAKSGSDFAHVDLSAQPDRYIHYLERAQQDGTMQTLKRQSYSLLEIHAGMRLLDAGCGIGDDVRALAELVGTQGEVIGLDNSQKLLAVARERSTDKAFPGVFQYGDIHQLPFADGSFDGCRTERVLIHSPTPLEALSEMRRVLKAGGRIVVIEPDLDTVMIALDDHALARKWTHWRCDSVRSGTIGRYLSGMFQQLGLSDIQTIPTVYYSLGSNLASLGKQVRLAQSQQALTEKEGAMLLSEIEQRMADHLYVEYGVFFLVAGRKS